MKLYKIILKCLCVLCVFSGTIYARTLADYKEGINNTRQYLAVIIYPDGEYTEEENNKFKQEFFDNIQKYVPAQEKIEIQGTTVETDNQWIYDKIGEYKDNSSADNSESADGQILILKEIYERLTAVELEIEKLENAADGGQTKDENKRKVSEILSREEYLKPQPQEESVFQKAVRKIKEWLNEMFPKSGINPGSTFEGLGAFANVVKYLIYALIISAIGFAIYKFAPFFFNKYKSREKHEKSERVILGEKLASDATAQSLFGDAENLAQQGDLRGAIRKGYIALLCELDDRKIVRLSKNKTNRDYLRDVRQNEEKLYVPVNGLTNNFERHWYGFDETNEKDWEEFRQNYRETVA